MSYCQEIYPVLPEDSWIVPLDVTQREIPPPYVDPSKPGRRTYRRWHKVGELFSTKKISVQYVGTSAIKKLHAQIEMPHKKF